MNILKVITASAILLSSYSALAGGGFQAARCAAWGDNLTQPQATERWNWAWKCDPANRNVLLMGRKYTAENGSIRPGYPIYGIIANTINGDPTNPKGYFAPKSEASGCNIPAGYTIVGFCVGGCYTADQFIALSDMDLSISDALKSGSVDIKTLESDSTIDSVKFKDGKISMYVKSIKSGYHEILSIMTESGKQIKVTFEHPLVDSSGSFVEARALKVGSKILNDFGESEIVVSIEKTKVFGKVYNLETKGNNMFDKVISAQGLLNGDVRIQNSKTAKINQLLLRTNLVPAELLK